MTNGNEPIYPNKEYGNVGADGLTKREYFAANNVTWRDAQLEFSYNHEKNGTIAEIASLLAEMKCAAADALIKQLNLTQ